MNDYYNEWDELEDCGYDVNLGICTMAGSEECEFDCPLRPMLVAKQEHQKKGVTSRIQPRIDVL